MFHQGDTKPHTSIVTRQKPLELGWNVFIYPAYSPQLAPSDYYLFLSSLVAQEKPVRLFQFSASRDECFYEKGIFNDFLAFLAIALVPLKLKFY